MDEFVREVAEAALGVPFLRSVTERLGVLYPETYDELAVEYEHPELHDLLPHVRRAKFERDLRRLALEHGIHAMADRNLRKTSFHTRVSAGEVILTASAVSTPKTIVRHAEFRQTLARDSQLSFFADPDNGGTAYYSIYIHGPLLTPHGFSLPKLGFAHLVFPDRTLSRYVGRVDLLDSYAPSFAPVNIPVEEIQKATITLLEQLKSEQA